MANAFVPIDPVVISLSAPDATATDNLQEILLDPLVLTLGSPDATTGRDEFVTPQDIVLAIPVITVDLVNEESLDPLAVTLAVPDLTITGGDSVVLAFAGSPSFDLVIPEITIDGGGSSIFYT